MKTNVPELPEVHTVTTDIKKALAGYTISSVWMEPLYKKLHEPAKFIKRVTGTKIVGAKRVAKNILIELEDEQYILIHLAMTGRVYIADKRDENVKWVKVVIEATNGKSSKTLHFSDVRMFGKVKLIDKDELKTLKNKYGPEPVTKIDNKAFAESISKLKRNIKSVLLDQTIIAGLGNIYATDTLFIAKIHPETPAKSLSKKQIDELLSGAQLVLNEGIKHRGSTLSDRMYVDAFGKEGIHQNFFRIYDKQICPSCGTKVEYKKIGGRGSYFCPNCQRN